MRYTNRTLGFTLIELMIVVIIIGALAAMVGPKLVGIISPAKEKIAQGDMATIASMLNRFEIENERFPSSEEGLDALRNKPADCPNWQGPYLDREPLDPWGIKYMYRYPSSEANKDFDIWSAGKDRKDGTEDDVKWPPKPK
ncbi:MAG: type II secretion system major pseudopilin GspG [Planctomycetes bacterium]|nr:type II secretion system major pseudopilin GspG [Planctomycetota bacterium]